VRYPLAGIRPAAPLDALGLRCVIVDDSDTFLDAARQRLERHELAVLGRSSRMTWVSRSTAGAIIATGQQGMAAAK
jgi:hypothetical protein